MNRRLFTKGGYQWSAMPHISVLPRSPARDVLSYLVDHVQDEGQSIEEWNREIAKALDMSVRWVQYAIADLIRRGYLAREFILEILEDGRKLWKRVLKLVRRPAGKDAKPKPQGATDLRVPSSVPPHAKSCGETLQGSASSPSFEGESKENSKAVVVDVPGGTGSPPTAEEERRLFEEAQAEIQAKLAAVRGAKAAQTPQDGPKAEGPPPGPAAAPITPRARLGRALEDLAAVRARLARLEEMRREGFPVAQEMGELTQVERHYVALIAGLEGGPSSAGESGCE